MGENGNNPDLIVAPALTSATRMRASGPILILAFLFVIGAFLSWYFTWFGRELSDEKISEYLIDDERPRRVQHAMLQIQQRLERGDSTVRHFYPQLLTLAEHSETEFRLTVAWLMGFDNRSQEFHQALLKLVNDPQPIVRRNAALALVRFNDPSGREELLRTLLAHPVAAAADGIVMSTLQAGSTIPRGALLARLEQQGQTIEVRSPLPGKIEAIVSPAGTRVTSADTILKLRSDEDSVWEALRGLSLIGEPEDLAVVSRYSEGIEPVAERIKEQAALTAKSIQSRGDKEKLNPVNR